MRPVTVDGKCTVEGCGKSHNAKGLCLTHYNRMKRNGTLEKYRPPQDGTNNPNWKGNDAAYMTVHSRLQVTKGRASSHNCIRCGRPALDWAYQYGSPDEVDSKFGPYSADLSFYKPMCRQCHRKFDGNRERIPA